MSNDNNNVESGFTSAFSAAHDALTNTDLAYRNIENQVSELIEKGRLAEEARDSAIDNLKSQYRALNEAYKSYPGTGSGSKAKDFLTDYISREIDSSRSQIGSLNDAIDALSDSQRSTLQSLGNYDIAKSILNRVGPMGDSAAVVDAVVRGDTNGLGSAGAGIALSGFGGAIGLHAGTLLTAVIGISAFSPIGLAIIGLSSAIGAYYGGEYGDELFSMIEGYGEKFYKWLWNETPLDEFGAWLGRGAFYLVDGIHDFFSMPNPSPASAVPTPSRWTSTAMASKPSVSAIGKTRCCSTMTATVSPKVPAGSAVTMAGWSVTSTPTAPSIPALNSLATTPCSAMARRRPRVSPRCRISIAMPMASSMRRTPPLASFRSGRI